MFNFLDQRKKVSESRLIQSDVFKFFCLKLKLIVLTLVHDNRSMKCVASDCSNEYKVSSFSYFPKWSVEVHRVRFRLNTVNIDLHKEYRQIKSKM